MSSKRAKLANLGKVWKPYGDEGPSMLELAQQAWSSTDTGYDLLARKFDATPFRTPDDAVEKALSVLHERDGTVWYQRGIDLCCGTGAGALQLERHCAHVFGLDRSEGMLDVAHQSVPRAHLVRADALAPPFRDGSFDVACSFGAFGHIVVDDEPRFVAAIARLLKPGGRFVFITADPPPLLSVRHVVARTFNAAMRVRNAVRKPEFIMYYLTFLLPRARRLLEDNGFEVHERRDLVDRYVVVDAVRR